MSGTAVVVVVFVVEAKKKKKSSNLLAGGAAEERRPPVDQLLVHSHARGLLEARDVRSGVLRIGKGGEVKKGIKQSRFSSVRERLEKQKIEKKLLFSLSGILFRCRFSSQK